jgi:hypothetical protein
MLMEHFSVYVWQEILFVKHALRAVSIKRILFILGGEDETSAKNKDDHRCQN